jgi:hypothetical protein
VVPPLQQSTQAASHQLAVIDHQDARFLLSGFDGLRHLSLMPFVAGRVTDKLIPGPTVNGQLKDRRVFDGASGDSVSHRFSISSVRQLAVSGLTVSRPELRNQPF